MLELLLNKESWESFLKSKVDNLFLSNYEKKQYKDFILTDKYLEICIPLSKGEYSFSVPKKHVISKHSSSKRRVVYTYSKEEMIVMKYISFLMYKYDYLFSDNLYSFRKQTGVRKAITRLSHTRKVKNLYGYKLDISNYFNSVDIPIFLNELKGVVDLDVYQLYKQIYEDVRVLFKKKIIHENKGAMAGVPLSSFSANFYIKDIDHFFEKEKVLYFRYADDIIFFTNSKEKRDYYIQILKDKLSEKKLSVNSDKESYIEPHQYFEFLGFGFNNHEIDLSKHSVKKMKAKIRRRARKLYRWKNEKGLTSENALVAFNRKMNRKFYSKNSDETSWSFWYFPLINTSKSLKEIDLYLQQEERYLFTGRHTKKNYKLCPYSKLKEYSYRPLVNEYYKFKKTKSNL